VRAVHDRVGPKHAVHLGAQLSILMRGFYYEGWRPGRTPTKYRYTEDFLDCVNGEIFHADSGIGPYQAVRAVFGVMSNRLDPGEVEKLIRLFPNELRELWPPARGAAVGSAQ
jgi:uncharacterized protein (DUF2267 family)